MGLSAPCVMRKEKPWMKPWQTEVSLEDKRWGTERFLHILPLCRVSQQHQPGCKILQAANCLIYSASLNHSKTWQKPVFLWRTFFLFQAISVFCLKKRRTLLTHGLFMKLTRVSSVLIKGLCIYCAYTAFRWHCEHSRWVFSLSLLVQINTADTLKCELYRGWMVSIEDLRC